MRGVRAFEVFIDTDLSKAQRLAVFGSIRGRRGSELKVLSAIETKMQGYFAQVRDLAPRPQNGGKSVEDRWSLEDFHRFFLE